MCCMYLWVYLFFLNIFLEQHWLPLLVADGSWLLFFSSGCGGLWGSACEGDDRAWWPAKARLAFDVPSPRRLLLPPPAHMGREIALHWRSPSHPSPRSTCPARQPWHHAVSDPSGFTVSDGERGDDPSVYHLTENKHKKKYPGCHGEVARSDSVTIDTFHLPLLDFSSVLTGFFGGRLIVIGLVFFTKHLNLQPLQRFFASLMPSRPCHLQRWLIYVLSSWTFIPSINP